MKSLTRLLPLVSVAFLVGCVSSYSKIERLDDGTYVLIRNQRRMFGGNKAEVLAGTYDPATKTMTITERTPPR